MKSDRTVVIDVSLDRSKCQKHLIECGLIEPIESWEDYELVKSVYSRIIDTVKPLTEDCEGLVTYNALAGDMLDDRIELVSGRDPRLQNALAILSAASFDRAWRVDESGSSNEPIFFLGLLVMKATTGRPNYYQRRVVESLVNLGGEDPAVKERLLKMPHPSLFPAGWIRNYKTIRSLVMTDSLILGPITVKS